MPTLKDFPATGRVASADSETVTFLPQNTSYELKLQTPAKYEGPLNARVEGLIRLSARKVYTVPSGGNFIAPIFGPPRIVQGRIKYLDDRNLVVQAGTAVIVELPISDAAYDLVNGPLSVGQLVNVTVLPGAKFEFLGVPAIR